MNADKHGSTVQPLCQIYSPIKQENLSKKTRRYSVVLQRKGDEEKRGAFFLGAFQLAAADGGNSNPVCLEYFAIIVGAKTKICVRSAWICVLRFSLCVPWSLRFVFGYRKRSLQP